MGLRLPLQTVLDYDDTGDVGASSVAGGVAKTFTIPQDADNIIVKFTASIAGTGASVFLQTTDDGGTTWYDVGRTSIVSNANTTTAEWLEGTVIGSGVKTQRTFGGSILTGTIGSAAASTIGQGQYSGLPILSPTGRVFIVYNGNVSASGNILSRVQVKVNSQSQGR